MKHLKLRITTAKSGETERWRISTTTWLCLAAATKNSIFMQLTLDKIGG
jgi:hypothetical protein